MYPYAFIKAIRKVFDNYALSLLGPISWHEAHVTLSRRRVLPHMP